MGNFHRRGQRGGHVPTLRWNSLPGSRPGGTIVRASCGLRGLDQGANLLRRNSQIAGSARSIEQRRPFNLTRTARYETSLNPLPFRECYEFQPHRSIPFVGLDGISPAASSSPKGRQMISLDASPALHPTIENSPALPKAITGESPSLFFPNLQSSIYNPHGRWIRVTSPTCSSRSSQPPYLPLPLKSCHSERALASESLP